MSSWDFTLDKIISSLKRGIVGKNRIEQLQMIREVFKVAGQEVFRTVAGWHWPAGGKSGLRRAP